MKSSSTLDSSPPNLIVETRVKERLTGAIILVGVLVLLVPELLTGPKRVPPASEASADEPPLRSYTIELNEDSSRKRAPPAPNIDASESPPPTGANSEMIDDSSEAVVDETAVESAAVADELQANTSADDESVAASDPSVASAPLRGATPTDVAKVAAASGSKVDSAKPTARDEPAPKAAASKAPPKEAAPKASAAKADSPKSTTSKGKGSGWAIQVGSFANRANADRLASELKGKGFAAFVSEGTNGGRKLYRVRVGPEADKAAAQSLAARLRAAGRAGSLVPHS